MQRRIFTLTVVSAAIFFAGCRVAGSTAELKVFSLSGDTVNIHLPDMVGDRIKTAVMQTESLSREVVTAGTVQAIPTQFAYIAPPFAGRITRSFVKLGQRVAPGTPLFEIISPEFTAMQKEYFQAESEREMARKDLLRKQELIAEGVCSDRELEEAQNAMKQAEKEYENAAAALRIYHVVPEKTVLGEPLVIRSPLAGNILENNIVAGQYLTEDAEPVAVVADLNKVWITAQVKEKDIRHIDEGDRMTVTVNALPDREIIGTVYHIEESVDEDTRSIRVLSVCDNYDESLKIGMYATVKFYGKTDEFVVVDEKAVMQSSESSYVLERLSDDQFVRRPVDVALTREGKAYMKGGIHEGDVVMAEGGYYFQ